MKYLSYLLVLTLGIMSCGTQQQEEYPENKPAEIIPLGTLPTWATNANIYEVNIRQYSEEGTFNEFTSQIPRLKGMGVDILWLMPIYPIGVEKRKGSLGSYYSIKDYTAVNPQFGTMEDCKKMIATAHENGMKVILDWVPNHTSWDHDWITEHPDWYTHDNDTITHPLDPNSGAPTGWTDVADLNYDNPDMKQAMIEEMRFWVNEMDMDGFRCDVAGFVPNDFWKECITQLNQDKHVFMLSEWADIPEHFDVGFHMNYNWALKDVIRELSEGKKTVAEFWDFYNKEKARFKDGAIRMNFITNHDENSWHNFPAILGEAEDAMAVLTYTIEGMPLIYSGQEARLRDTVSFFHKDVFDWEDIPLNDFYTALNQLKHDNAALANGKYGGSITPIQLDNPNILAFKREKDKNVVEVYINLGEKTTITIPDFDKKKVTIPNPEYQPDMTQDVEMPQWDYLVLTSNT